MSEKRPKQIDIIGIVTIGFFVLLVGVIFAITPNLLDKISDFLRDFELREITPNWKFPAPKSNHPVLYTAVFQFCLAFAIFQVFVLGARIILKDPIDRIAGTISNLFFWFGASWVMNLLIAGTVGWFVLLGLVVILIGMSVIIKNFIVLMTKVSPIQRV